MLDTSSLGSNDDQRSERKPYGLYSISFYDPFSVSTRFQRLAGDRIIVGLCGQNDGCSISFWWVLDAGRFRPGTPWSFFFCDSHCGWTMKLNPFGYNVKLEQFTSLLLAVKLVMVEKEQEKNGILGFESLLLNLFFSGLQEIWVGFHRGYFDLRVPLCVVRRRNKSSVGIYITEHNGTDCKESLFFHAMVLHRGQLHVFRHDDEHARHRQFTTVHRLSN